MDQVIELRTHKFGDLNKYLKPLFDSIESCQETEDEKRVLFVRRAIAEFFQRVRVYKDIDISKPAQLLKMTTKEFTKIEDGEDTLSNEDFFTLTDLYQVSHQAELLFASLETFKNPSSKQFKKDIAVDLVKRFGIQLPGINLKDIKAPMGKVISFSKNK